MTTHSTSTPPVPDTEAPQWGERAPKGAKAVFSRMIKDGASVPLFLSQTLMSSLRDVGYNSTTSAICEHVDNAIQWGATEVRVYFNQRGRKGDWKIDVLVLDNGKGMAPNVLKVACAFGGSMLYDNRTGIGRYGMGMKTAALSMGPLFEVYSWQALDTYYRMILDVQDVGQAQANVVNLPEPQLGPLSREIRDILTKDMAFPKNPEDQELLIRDQDELAERLGRSGTIVFVPDCDRLTHVTAKPLVENTTREFARIYRRQIAAGLKVFVNNRRIEFFDPTYRMGVGPHVVVEPPLKETRSRLAGELIAHVAVEEDSKVTHPVKVQLYTLPLAEWSALSTKVLKNDLHVYDGETVSFMRSDREVHRTHFQAVAGKFASSDYWWRMEIDFPPELDEAFGVSFNKQGVRPKGYVIEELKRLVKGDLRQVKDSIFEYMRSTTSKEARPKLSEAEKRANEAEALMATILPEPKPTTDEQKKELENNLKELARNLRHDSETEEEAVARVTRSRYLTQFANDEDAPFYRVDYRFGKVILKINAAHPFYSKLYEPLQAMEKAAAVPKVGDEDTPVEREVLDRASEALGSLNLLLLSLGRTQGVMLSNDDDGDLKNVFDQLRGQWSLTLKTLLSKK
jgi:hypothetical protein